MLLLLLVACLLACLLVCLFASSAPCFFCSTAPPPSPSSVPLLRLPPPSPSCSSTRWGLYAVGLCCDCPFLAANAPASTVCNTGFAVQYRFCGVRARARADRVCSKGGACTHIANFSKYAAPPSVPSARQSAVRARGARAPLDRGVLERWCLQGGACSRIANFTKYAAPPSVPQR